ncbi:MAG: hypothetical protein J0M12_16310 [Deltaproteobacteria bacterium]|nr:hypothetical protein [Deltaproteobacteria bacterium]
MRIVRGLVAVTLMTTLAAASGKAEVRRHLSDAFASQTFVISSSAGKFTCGLSGSAWVSGKLSRSNFLPFATQIKALKLSAKSAGPAKKAKLLAKIKTLKTTMKKGNAACKNGPPSGGGGGGGTQPTATPTPAAPGNFDMAGNVTAKGKALFGIPSSLNGNISAGRSTWQAQCMGCHSDKLNRTMSQYRGLISQAPMFFDSNEIPDSTLANLTAYLNRFRQ